MMRGDRSADRCHCTLIGRGPWPSPRRKLPSFKFVACRVRFHSEPASPRKFCRGVFTVLSQQRASPRMFSSPTYHPTMPLFVPSQARQGIRVFRANEWSLRQCVAMRVPRFSSISSHLQDHLASRSATPHRQLHACTATCTSPAPCTAAS